MKNPIIYVVLNGELGMSSGKVASQAVHAAMLLNNDSKKKFLTDHERTVIVLEAKNSEQIKNLNEYLQGAGIFSAYYIDEGRNEVDAYSVTALAAEPIESEDEERRAVFEAFPLFGKRQSTFRGIRWQ